MKKILFATTALIATAGMAAADVRLSGYGRFGLDYNDANARTGLNGQGGAANGVSETNITSRLRIQFDMSTETDSGVALGARLRLQTESRDNVVNGNGAGGTTTANGARFYASYGGFTVQVGNITGAIEGMAGLYLPTSSADTGIDGMGFHSLVGNTVGGNAFAWDAYSSAGTGRNGIELIYSGGAFGAHFSYSTTNGAIGLDRIAVSGKYTFGDWTVGLGIQDSDTIGEDKVILTVAGDIGQFGVGLAYGMNSDAGGLGVDIDKLRIYGKMDVGSAGTVLAWVTDEDGAAGAVTNGTSFGLNYKHDLGGGVSFDAGFVETVTDQTQVQAGVYFRF
ncbi:MAG: porin [Rhodobacteraceae bacterium]|nr:porin [Paracoccaceae bacterium]